MPASERPNTAIASGNCGNPRRRGAGRGRPETRTRPPGWPRPPPQKTRSSRRSVSSAGIRRAMWPSPFRGQPGTALADDTAPEPWQREVLQKLDQGLMSAVCFSAA
jgi:hypothetical protein